MSLEPNDLIEDIHLQYDHAEKFLLATVSPINGELELICGNGNRWPMPKNCVNLGSVVVAYYKMRELAARAVDGHDCSCYECAKDRETFYSLIKLKL